MKGQALETSIPSISKQVLEDLEIAIPSLEIQNIILRIAELRNKEKLLKQKIEALREIQIQKQINNIIYK